MKKKTKKNRTKYSFNSILLVVFSLFVLTALFRFLPRKNSTTPCPNPGIVQLTNFVDEAANLLSQEGEQAFLKFKENGQWWQGESFLFVYDINGKTLVLPPQPYLEGTNRFNIKDSQGTYFVKEMINQLKDHDFGWLQYFYPKPGESEPLPKLVYFRKVNLAGKIVIIGSGIYLK